MLSLMKAFLAREVEVLYVVTKVPKSMLGSRLIISERKNSNYDSKKEVNLTYWTYWMGVLAMNYIAKGAGVTKWKVSR